MYNITEEVDRVLAANDPVHPSAVISTALSELSRIAKYHEDADARIKACLALVEIVDKYGGTLSLYAE